MEQWEVYADQDAGKDGDLGFKTSNKKVRSVDPDGWACAYDQGMRKGDRILALNGESTEKMTNVFTI